ncbi:MAG: ABC transporter permease [Bacteroidota bacterium]
MREIIIKLSKDFWVSKGKLLLLVLAASLSSWGISSMVYSYTLANRDFAVNFERTHPADFSLTIQAKPGVVEPLLEQVPGVIGVEPRGTYTARVRDGRGNWMPLLLFVVDDIEQLRYDKFVVMEAADAMPGKLLLEKNSVGFLSPEASHLEILFPQHTESVRLPLDGLVHDARMAPSRMEGTLYAYVTSPEVVRNYLPDSVQRVLVKTNAGPDKEAIEAVYEEVSSALEAHQIPVLGYSIPTPGEHMHQGIVDGIALLQRAGGTVLSAMGLILLSLILLTWIYPQVADIGVMKAIGASTRAVGLGYFIVLGSIISVGLAVGLPLGYQTAVLYNRFIAMLQNFDPVTTPLPFGTHVAVLGLSFAVPMLVVSVPILRSSRISVRQALQASFVIPFQGHSLISRLPTLSLRGQYVVNNLFRRLGRSGLILLLICLGVGIYFTAINMEYSIQKDLQLYADETHYPIAINLAEPMPFEALGFIGEEPGVGSYQPIDRKEIAYFPPQGGEKEVARLTQVPPQMAWESSDLLRGQLERSCADCLYVGGQHMTDQFADIPLGASVVLQDQDGQNITYRFSGVVKDRMLLRSSFYVLGPVESVVGFVAVSVAGKDGQPVALSAVSKALDEAFLDKGLALKDLMSVDTRMAMILNHLAPTFLIIQVMGYFTVALGLLGLLIVLNLSIRERTRELGILKALGGSFPQLSRMLNHEFLVLSAVACLVGVLLALPSAQALIETVATAIIGHEVPLQMNFLQGAVSLGALILLQVGLVYLNNRRKLRGKTHTLLGHIG